MAKKKNEENKEASEQELPEAVITESGSESVSYAADEGINAVGEDKKIGNLDVSFQSVDLNKVVEKINELVNKANDSI